eukprot:6214710-Pleurochrysis_carterae.AAC.2
MGSRKSRDATPSMTLVAHAEMTKLPWRRALLGVPGARRGEEWFDGKEVAERLEGERLRERDADFSAGMGVLARAIFFANGCHPICCR